MSVKSFAEAVKEGVTRYTRGFGIEQAEAEEAEFAAVGSDGTVGGPGGTALSPSVVNGSAVADYVVAEVGGNIVATPSAASGLPKHEGTTSEVGTVINAALASLQGAGHLHLALGSVSTNDAEIVIVGAAVSNPYSPAVKLIVTGDGKTTLSQASAGLNTLVVKNAASVDLSGFRLFSGTAAASALLLSDKGSESEISAVASRIDLSCSSTSTSSPAVVFQNAYQCTVPMLRAINGSNDGLVIENTSTTINYGNSAFGVINVYASKASPHAGLKILTTHHEHFPNLITFDFVQCVGSGYYGIYSLGARNITITKVDLENMVAPVWCDGNSEGAQTKNLKILSGYIQAVEANPAITNTKYTAGNSFDATIEGGATCVPIEDSSLYRSVNKYGLILENVASANNISIVNPSTRLDLRRTDGGVIASIGTNRQSRIYTGAHTFEPEDMGLVAEYNSASAGTFTVAPFAEKALPVGTTIRVYQAGVGQLTVAAGAGVTIRNPNAFTFGQYAEAELRCRGLNEWVLSPLSSAAVRTLRMMGSLGSALTTAIGMPTTTQGTATARSFASTNMYTRLNRIGYVGAATANASAGLIGTKQFNGTDGYTITIVGGIAAYNAGHQYAIGLANEYLATKLPSEMVSLIAMCANPGDTTWKIRAGASSLIAPVELGGEFPVNTSEVDMYELTLEVAPGATTGTYKVVRLNTGATATGTFAKAPGITTGLAMMCVGSNLATGVAANMDVAQITAVLAH
jgi:hypothetical protein